MVRNLPSNAGDVDLISGWRIKIPHVWGQPSPSVSKLLSLQLRPDTAKTHTHTHVYIYKENKEVMMKEWLRQGTMIRATSFTGGVPASRVSLERDWEKRVNNIKERPKFRDT